MAKRRIASVTAYYESGDLRDAPEYYEHARAMGTLTWGTWDHSIRPFEQRRQDFVAAFPPADPVRFSPGGSLIRQQDGTFAPGSAASRLQRFLADDWLPGSIHELLSRYGLKLSGGPAYRERSFLAGAFRDSARKRNHRLRVLHGGVDVEAADMDAAKAEFLDLQEKKKAAEQVREAVRQMNAELAKADGDDAD
jgi:hypothetical protein